jgi:hypothetical protein
MWMPLVCSMCCAHSEGCSVKLTGISLGGPLFHLCVHQLIPVCQDFPCFFKEVPGKVGCLILDLASNYISLKGMNLSFLGSFLSNFFYLDYELAPLVARDSTLQLFYRPCLPSATANCFFPPRPIPPGLYESSFDPTLSS